MRRAAKHATVSGLALGLAALLGLGGLTACVDEPPVPTAEVERRDFVHRVTADGVLEAAASTRLSVPTAVRRTVRLAWLAPEGAPLAEGDLVARFDPRPLEETIEDNQASIARTDASIVKQMRDADGELADVDKKVAVSDLDLEHARRYQKLDDQVYSRREILDSAIDEELAAERRRHAEATRETLDESTRAGLDLLAIEKRGAQSEVEQAEETLAGLEMRAPHEGVLILIRDWNGDPPQVGSEMWRGQEIAEIPDLSKMQAEVFVLEADAGGLEIGQPAEVVIESDPDTVYPARVSGVEPVAKPRFAGSPVQYFGVVLELEVPRSETMKPGQRVRATVRLAERDDALVVPRQAVVRDGEETYVWRATGDGFVRRRVEAGPSSLGHAVIESGLEAGDRVALRPPERPLEEAPDGRPVDASEDAVEAASTSSSAGTAGGGGAGP